MPFDNQTDVISPFLLFGIPQKTPKIAFVVLSCSGTLTVGMLGKNEAFDERYDGCADGHL